MSPPPGGTISLGDRGRYERGLIAQLGALRLAAQQARRLTDDQIDSIGGAAAGLDPPAFHELARRLAPGIARAAGPEATGAAWHRLDSLRAEVLVWRVRAGP